MIFLKQITIQGGFIMQQPFNQYVNQTQQSLQQIQQIAQTLAQQEQRNAREFQQQNMQQTMVAPNFAQRELQAAQQLQQIQQIAQQLQYTIQSQNAPSQPQTQYYNQAYNYQQQGKVVQSNPSSFQSNTNVEEVRRQNQQSQSNVQQQPNYYQQ